MKKILSMVMIFLIALLIFSIFAPKAKAKEWYWPTFHHDNFRCGYTSSAVPREMPSLYWMFDASYYPGGSVTISGTTAYVMLGTYENSEQKETLFALDVIGKTVKWQRVIGEPYVSFSSPAISNGIVYVGSANNKVVALNESNGDLVWEFTTGREVFPSPAVANGVVFIGSYDGCIYALDQFNGSLVWSFVANPYNNPVSNSLAVADNIVFTGSYTGDVYAINATTGTEVWNFHTGGLIFSSPVVSGDKVFVGSYDGRMYALNKKTGELAWSYVIAGPVTSTPAVAHNMILFQSFDGKVYALNQSTGDLIWMRDFNSNPEVYHFSSPAVANDTVLVTSLGVSSMTLHAIDAFTGIELWNYTNPYGLVQELGPSIAGNLIFVGLGYDIYIFGEVPPTEYTLTITVTAGGTTDPAPGTYTYVAGSSVEITAIPDADYVFDHWELDDTDVGSANPYIVLMDTNHTLKAVFTYSPPSPPLSVSINPLSASINVGGSVTFTSTVSGGTSPYSYQWYLNDNPVSGANKSSWTFTPTTSGIYYVYLKVTDAKGNTTQSETARITVATVPVGGYSYPINKYTLLTPIATHIALIAILTATFIIVKRKAKRKH